MNKEAFLAGVDLFFEEHKLTKEAAGKLSALLALLGRGAGKGVEGAGYLYGKAKGKAAPLLEKLTGSKAYQRASEFVGQHPKATVGAAGLGGGVGLTAAALGDKKEPVKPTVSPKKLPPRLPVKPPGVVDRITSALQKLDLTSIPVGEALRGYGLPAAAGAALLGLTSEPEDRLRNALLGAGLGLGAGGAWRAVSGQDIIPTKTASANDLLLKTATWMDHRAATFKKAESEKSLLLPLLVAGLGGGASGAFISPPGTRLRGGLSGAGISLGTMYLIHALMNKKKQNIPALAAGAGALGAGGYFMPAMGKEPTTGEQSDAYLENLRQQAREKMDQVRKTLVSKGALPEEAEEMA